MSVHNHHLRVRVRVRRGACACMCIWCCAVFLRLMSLCFGCTDTKDFGAKWAGSRSDVVGVLLDANTREITFTVCGRQFAAPAFTQVMLGNGLCPVISGHEGALRVNFGQVIAICLSAAFNMQIIHSKKNIIYLISMYKNTSS